MNCPSCGADDWLPIGVSRQQCGQCSEVVDRAALLQREQQHERMQRAHRTELVEEPNTQLLRVRPPRRVERVLIVDKRTDRRVRLVCRAQVADDGTLTVQVDDDG
jgi:hypothetical protein